MKFLLASATLAAVFSTVVMAAPAGNERRQNYFTSAHYDDQDSVVSYTGNWTHITSENFQLQSRTESFSKTPNAEAHFPNPFPQGADHTFKVTVFSTKKNDRGAFSVYCGKKLIGTGSEYFNGPETSSGVVYQSDTVSCKGGDDFVVKNDKGAKWLAVDALKLEYH